LNKDQWSPLFCSGDFFEDLVQTLSVWRHSNSSQESMNLLKLALQIVDRVLPSEDFDRRGGDCQLEEIQNHANLTI
jgi:hypothetical protein